MCSELTAINFLSADHPCANHNGGCAQLCLLKPGGYTCLCPIEIDGSCQTIPTSTISTTSMSVSRSSTENQISASPSLSKAKSSPPQLATTTPLSSAPISSSAHPVREFCFHQFCENGAICQEEHHGYKCLCIGYFIGRNCSIDISTFCFVKI